MREGLFGGSTAFWTIRRSLAAVAMIALIAVTGGQFWISASYRSLAFDAFTDQQARMVRLLAEDRIRVRYEERVRAITASWARNEALTKAMLDKDAARMAIEAEALFAQADVTLGNIVLVGAHVFTPELERRASAARGIEASLLDDAALRAMYNARDKGEARQATSMLWSGPDGQPLHSVLLPIGGFRVQGYLEVITDPLPTLIGLATAFGGDVAVQDTQGALRLIDHVPAPTTGDATVPANSAAEPSADAALAMPEAGPGTVLVPVTLTSHDGIPWAVVTLASDIHQFTDALEETRNTALAGLVVLVLGLGAVTLLLLRQTVFRTLKDFATAMISIAEDRQADIPRTGKDEMASMAKALIVLRERSAELKVVQQAQREEAEAHQREVRERLRALSEALARELDETVGPVLRQTQELTGVSNSLSNAAIAMRERSDAVRRSASDATTKTESVSDTARHLAEAIRLVRDRADQSRDIADTASGEVTSAREMVARLADAASEIDAVVTLITDIAGQTNLLALNATIEAARAGEAGKGFAVVAGEVKTLAGRTSQATGDISGKVEEVQNRTQSAVTAIGAIAETIERMTAMAGDIARTVDAQEEATRQMIADTETATGNTRTVSGDIDTVAERSRAVGDLAGAVSKAAAAVNDGLDRLRHGLDRIAREAEANAG